MAFGSTGVNIFHATRAVHRLELVLLKVRTKKGPNKLRILGLNNITRK
jgi:hypothetical protein